MGKDLLKLLGCGFGGVSVIELRDNRFGQQDLRLFGVSLLRICQCCDFFCRQVGKQCKVVFHHIVGDTHHLAEHIIRLIGNTDIVALGFAHFLPAVQAYKDGDGDNDLRRLIVHPLKVPANEIVEGLVSSA